MVKWKAAGRQLLAAVLLASSLRAHGRVIGATSRVGAETLSLTPAGAKLSTKYLITSFPRIREVAYVHLPDNVWRPLVIGPTISPESVAVDSQNARLFVADPRQSVVWWMSLVVNSDGLLQTQGGRQAAVEGFSANWLAVNGVGDLYFTGHSTRGGQSSRSDSVYRQDASKIASGRTMSPVEVYSRSNTGSPNPKAWAPSGLSVDSFNIYWGNGANGTEHGSVVKGSRMNLGSLSQEAVLEKLTQNVDEVRGVAATGTHVFYVSRQGVHGVTKSEPTTVTDPNVGLISTPPGNGDTSWNPVSLTYDGENTLYLSDYAGGCIYAVPSHNILEHNLTKFVDAPNAHGLAVFGMHSGYSMRALGVMGIIPVLAAVSALLAPLL
mmetsp:Transcript_33476/g.75889  ORF Transcript_33476/g.75889 Transcript_33476/m.75889 type:complete len:380 (-) Transcript_33476:94-1233(-)|eukprot:CAMPEP_0197893078 /NCGR_PEP_ID=MMETSP1439-20131203/32544_1 /TAXON_ID=66791 /ORGANISM="Gonyaulax spinifera, Strain CCMP409" /LENGTH=379 /DNA_ID=CAMNT_0043513327 /DNA_START=100 /DNA_END=1239 /DNA_ORIENTATION=+